MFPKKRFRRPIGPAGRLPIAMERLLKPIPFFASPPQWVSTREAGDRAHISAYCMP